MTTGEYLSGAPGPNRTSRFTAPLAAVVVLLFGASVVGLVTVASSGGAGSPEGAVEKLFAAIDDEDALGMMDALVPGERDALRSGVVDLFAELRRLEILGQGGALDDLPGLDFSVKGLTLTSEPLGDGKATVSVTGGTLASRADFSQLFGDFVTDLAGGGDPGEPEESDEPIEDVNLVSVKEGGSWYVSLWYSAAEAIRRDIGAPVPNFGSGLKATGADSPEAAVEDLFRAFVGLDLRRILQLLPPDEAAAVHDYAPLFLDPAEKGLDDVRSFFDAEITKIELDSTSVDRGRLVTVRSMEFRAAFPGFGSIEVVGDCLRLSFEGEALEEYCGDDVEDLAGQAPPGFEEFGEAFADIGESGFIAVEQDGNWYVSPTRSMLELLVTAARALDRSDLDAFVKGFGDIVGGIPS